MAVPDYGHWEVRTDGHNDNGGCFNPTRSGATKTWDDNYTYGPSYMVVIYDGQTGNEPVLTPNGTALNQVRCDGGRAFVQADVGHVIKITAGTNVTPGRYEITSVSGGVATLDANCWTSTSGSQAVARLGGAVAHPSEAILGANSANFIWIRSGTYTVTSTISRRWSWLRLHVRGYEQTRLDMGQPPVLQAGASSITLLHITNSNDTFSSVWNVTFSGNGYTGVNGFGGEAARTHLMYRCTFDGLATGINSGLDSHVVACTFTNCSIGTTGGRVFHCLATNCSTVGIQAHVAYACMAVGCGDGFRSYPSAQGTFINCIARNCTGRGFYGNDSRGGAFINCIAHNCGGHGFFVHSRNHSAHNCIATNCGQNGFYFDDGAYDVMGMTGMRLAAYNNTSGNWGNLVTTWGHTWGLRQILSRSLIDLSAPPFVDASNGDFRLNSLPGGGALCRAAGMGPVWQQSALDIGVVQTASSGGTTIFVFEDD